MLPLLNFSPPLSLRPSPPPFIDDVVKTLNTLATYLVNTGVRSGTAHLYISVVFVVIVVVFVVVFIVIVIVVVADIIITVCTITCLSCRTSHTDVYSYSFNCSGKVTEKVSNRYL